MHRQVTLDHVAVLAADLGAAASRFAPLGLQAGPVDRFPEEGTCEQYLGAPGAAARLLLMQPLGEEGPYARALSKRGAGLHHVALRVADLEAFVAGLRGWLLHPHSLASAADGVLWLARPGIGCLVEVFAGERGPEEPPALEAIEVPAPAELRELLAFGVGVAGLEHSPDRAAWVRAKGQRLPVC